MMPISALGRRWIEVEPVREALALAAELNLHPQLGSWLWQQGHRTSEQVRAFLEPRLQTLGDPFLISDLRRAVERLKRSITRQERIVIFGDYDVDGITSCAFLWRVLRALGAKVETYLPRRMEEGYGLSQDGVERCLEQHHPELLVAVDCGTTAQAAVAWLQARSVEVIIIDHHALPLELPEAVALVNPQRDGSLTYLATVGLVFKVCHGLLKLWGEGTRPIDLRDYLDLVAVGTVADIVPLIGENRVLVRRGLKQAEQSRWVGLRALLEVSQTTFPITARAVGFRLGPRLNASGRLGDAMLSLRLLQTDSPTEALELAQELDLHNRERQKVEQKTLEQAEAQAVLEFVPARDWAIVLAGADWHWGVIGIVASRLQKRYHRPTIIIGLDREGQGKGSGRSLDGISLVCALKACRAHLDLFGGHDMAAGLSIQAGNVPAFRIAFLNEVKQQAEGRPFEMQLALSGRLAMKEVSADLFNRLDELAPFGRENPEPVFAFEGIRYTRPAQPFGRNHIRLYLATGEAEVEAVGFSLGDRDLNKPPRLLAGTLEWDDYRNRVQVRIADWLP